MWRESRHPKLYWYADKCRGTHFQAIVVIDIPLPGFYTSFYFDIYTEHKLTQTMAQMLLSLSLLSSLIRLYKQTHERSEQNHITHSIRLLTLLLPLLLLLSISNDIDKFKYKLPLHIKPNSISLNNQLWLMAVSLIALHTHRNRLNESEMTFWRNIWSN